MNRRTFLRHVLDASAATTLLSISQATALKREIAALHVNDETLSPVAGGLLWLEPVKTTGKLPQVVEEGSAVLVESTGQCFIYINVTGWIPLTLCPTGEPQ